MVTSTSLAPPRCVGWGRGTGRACAHTAWLRAQATWSGHICGWMDGRWEGGREIRREKKEESVTEKNKKEGNKERKGRPSGSMNLSRRSKKTKGAVVAADLLPSREPGVKATKTQRWARKLPNSLELGARLPWPHKALLPPKRPAGGTACSGSVQGRVAGT